jgi:D-sedoheptulose 7-phosphate isomerase
MRMRGGVIAFRPDRGEAARERPISAIAPRLSTKIADLTGSQPTAAPQIALDRPRPDEPSGERYGCKDPVMTATVIAPVKEYLAQSRDTIQAAIDDPAFATTIAAIVDRIAAALGAGHKLLLAGNGGSAGDAQHIAGEFLSRLNYDRAPTAAIALTTDSSVLTAIANDYGYERVFERQVLGLGRPGDVLIAISTSGRSPNILRAIAAARASGLVTIGFTGKSGGDMATQCDLCLRAPSDVTQLTQQIHITAGHIVCGLVEERLFPCAGAARPLAAAEG